MQAIVHSTYGISSLALTDQPAPLPRPGEVLVRVAGAGVDRGVWHLVTGRPLLMRLGTGLFQPRNTGVGIEVSGTVEAVGEGVTRFRLDDRVFGVGRSTFAELAVAQEGNLAPAPESIPLADAAALPVSALTALQAVRAAEIGDGAQVLVLGASGGVGTHAVQIAVARGAEVTAVCSTRKAPRVLELGVTRVLDYLGEESAVVAAGPYDAIIDTGGNRPASQLTGLLARGGSAVIVGGEQAGTALLGGFSRQLIAPLVGLVGRRRLVSLVSVTSAADLIELVGLVESGQLRPVVDQRLPLARAGEALNLLASGAVTGKLVLQVD
ncbi:NAD(P)-dependent alcohol dehydrogenase [Corynebacterium hylobatis]|uniref:NAD(P)-dependent alcohol dehydrogenase n=1 Tax=Corynebacterium hylobatis TaxID=1859290 RepID=A0A3R9ZFT2_9CORY|nr:NAD(P)-dependent alcohol dehydrogenase [Corynebacterium hylobatis]RSZ65623.1 NAD(P)-dependent alcohol dehydrogenase [Corynebacterium hylobatis]